MNHESPLQAPPAPNPVEELLAQARLGIDRAEALDLLTRQTGVLTDALLRIHETVTAASVQAALIHEALRVIRYRSDVLPASDLRLPELSTGSAHQRKSPQCVLMGLGLGRAAWLAETGSGRAQHQTHALQGPSRDTTGWCLTGFCRPVPPVATR